MEYMNEDGNLNVELIDSLPLDKHVEVMGRLTEAQIDEYFLNNRQTKT